MPIDEYLQKYVDQFEEGFPMYQLGRTRTDEEVIRIIKRCLDANMTAYDLGLVTDDEDTEY